MATYLGLQRIYLSWYELIWTLHLKLPGFASFPHVNKPLFSARLKTRVTIRNGRIIIQRGKKVVTAEQTESACVNKKQTLFQTPKCCWKIKPLKRTRMICRCGFLAWWASPCFVCSCVNTQQDAGDAIQTIFTVFSQQAERTCQRRRRSKTRQVCLKGWSLLFSSLFCLLSRLCF